MKRMKHPEHGWHVPMPGEVDSMLKNGWTWEVAEAPAAPPDPQPSFAKFAQEMAEEAQALAPKRKPGRPRKDSGNAASSDADQ